MASTAANEIASKKNKAWSLQGYEATFRAASRRDALFVAAACFN